MDSANFLVRQATSITEYKAGQKVRMKGRTDKPRARDAPEEIGVVVDEEEHLVTGFPASGHGVDYRPWFNYAEGIAGCNCNVFESGSVTFCRHVLGLFESLKGELEESCGNQFINCFNASDFHSSSTKTKSESVPTGIDSVDELLGGGIPRSAVTLLAGMTKVGKTWWLTQTAFQAAMKGKKVLYIDSEGMFQRQDGFGAFETILRNRFDYEGDLKENLFFTQEYRLKDVAKLFGISLGHSSGGRKLTLYTKDDYPEDDTPIIHLCRAKNIDLVILDSITDLIKPVIGADQQNLPARAAIINKLWPRFEALARECDIGFVLVSHSSRSYDFRLYTDGDDKGILDEPVDSTNAGVWGASALMYNVKHFIQLENCTRSHCKKKNIKHFMRRLMPGQASSHIDLEMIRDYGYVEY